MENLIAMDDAMDPQMIDAAGSAWGYILVGLFSFLTAITTAYFKGKGEVKSAVNESIGMVLDESRKQTADMRAQLEWERKEHKRELAELATFYKAKIDEMKASHTEEIEGLRHEIQELRRRQNEISEPV